VKACDKTVLAALRTHTSMPVSWCFLPGPTATTVPSFGLHAWQVQDDRNSSASLEASLLPQTMERADEGNRRHGCKCHFT
jgi:hypothetical protein